MDKTEILIKLKKAYDILQEGLAGEFDGYEGTNDQPDCRLTEASIAFEELIDNIMDDMSSEALNSLPKIDIGNCEMDLESGVLKIYK